MNPLCAPDERGIHDANDEGSAAASADASNRAGGNHALWTMGHLAFLEGGIYALVTDSAHPTPSLGAAVRARHTAIGRRQRLPAAGELIGAYQKYRANNIEALNKMDDAGWIASPGTFLPLRRFDAHRGPNAAINFVAPDAAYWRTCRLSARRGIQADDVIARQFRFRSRRKN